MKPNIKQAAEHYGVSTYTISKWCRVGKLVAFRIARDWIIDIEASDNKLKAAAQV